MNRVAEPPSHTVSPLSAEVAKVLAAKRYCQWCFWCSYSFDMVLVVVAIGRQSVQGKLLHRFRADWCFHFTYSKLQSFWYMSWDIQIYSTVDLFTFHLSVELHGLPKPRRARVQGEWSRIRTPSRRRLSRWVDGSMGEVAMRRQEKWILCLLLPAPVTDTGHPDTPLRQKQKSWIWIVCEKKLAQHSERSQSVLERW